MESKKEVKKSTKKSASTKKGNNVKTVKKEVPSKTKKKVLEKGKADKEQKITTERVLLAIFILLLILVVFLAIKVVLKKKEVEKNKADLVVPILKVSSEEELSLNLSALVEDEEYILKIVNYKDEKVNEEEIPYTITIENNSDSEIEVTKDYSDHNFMIDQEAVIIEDQKLRGKVKQDVYYHIKITKEKNVKNSDEIGIKIAS